MRLKWTKAPQGGVYADAFDDRVGLRYFIVRDGSRGWRLEVWSLRVVVRTVNVRHELLHTYWTDRQREAKSIAQEHSSAAHLDQAARWRHAVSQGYARTDCQ